MTVFHDSLRIPLIGSAQEPEVSILKTKWTDTRLFLIGTDCPDPHTDGNLFQVKICCLDPQTDSNIISDQDILSRMPMSWFAQIKTQCPNPNIKVWQSRSDLSSTLVSPVLAVAHCLGLLVDICQSGAKANLYQDMKSRLQA